MANNHGNPTLGTEIAVSASSPRLMQDADGNRVRCTDPAEYHKLTPNMRDVTDDNAPGQQQSAPAAQQQAPAESGASRRARAGSGTGDPATASTTASTDGTVA